MDKQLTIFDQLIGHKAKMVNRDGVIVMVNENGDCYLHHCFEKNTPGPFIKKEYAYSVCYPINEVHFID